MYTFNTLWKKSHLHEVKLLALFFNEIDGMEYYIFFSITDSNGSFFVRNGSNESILFYIYNGGNGQEL